MNFRDTLILGMVIGVIGAVVGNLLTPFINPLWAKLVSLLRYGAQARIRQEIKTLQRQLDLIHRRRTGAHMTISDCTVSRGRSPTMAGHEVLLWLGWLSRRH